MAENSRFKKLLDNAGSSLRKTILPTPEEIQKKQETKAVLMKKNIEIQKLALEQDKIRLERNKIHKKINNNAVDYDPLNLMGAKK